MNLIGHRALGRAGHRAGLAAIVAITVAGLGFVGLPAQGATELVVNGGFGGGTTAGWWSNDNTAIAVDNGRLRVDVAGGTANPWEAMVGQSGVPLIAGTRYLLSFAASATTPQSVRTTVQLEDPPYTEPLGAAVSLAPTARRFELAFTSNLTTGRGQVTFHLGGKANAFTVFLDDISLMVDRDGGPAEAFPDETTTGVPPGTQLRRHDGNLVVDVAGTVVDGLDIRGCVEVHADNVTVRRTKIACTTGWYPVRIFGDRTGVLLEDIEITGRPDAESIAVASQNYTLRRANIHQVSDGPRVGDNTVVEDSYIHDLVRCAGCHLDGIQSTGGSHIRIRHNNIQHPRSQTSCILLGEEFEPMDDAIVEDNLLNGGNYTIYAGEGTTDPNIIIRNNHFGRDAVYGLLSDAPGARVQWTDNVWHDTGETIPEP